MAGQSARKQLLFSPLKMRFLFHVLAVALLGVGLLAEAADKPVIKPGAEAAAGRGEATPGQAKKKQAGAPEEAEEKKRPPTPEEEVAALARGEMSPRDFGFSLLSVSYLSALSSVCCVSSLCPSAACSPVGRFFLYLSHPGELGLIACTTEYNPVRCITSGQIYTNPCFAMNAGVEEYQLEYLHP
ncbi:hypothetical protein Efla_007874 [Eimeria flavescens]